MLESGKILPNELAVCFGVFFSILFNSTCQIIDLLHRSNQGRDNAIAFIFYFIWQVCLVQLCSFLTRWVSIEHGTVGLYSDLALTICTLFLQQNTQLSGTSDECSLMQI